MHRSKRSTNLNSSRGFKLVAAGLIVLLLGLVVTTALGQKNSWELGPYKLLAGPPSAPLTVRMNGARGLGSFSFVGSVGGIAFEAVATPDSSLKGKEFKLSYDRSQKDGRRVAITIGKEVYHPLLQDWMLVPISKYADSPYTACVSLFGPRTSAAAYDIVYHPAFQNTLMGLRLLQADMLLMSVGKFWDLPRFNGKLVLGLGESAPNKSKWISAAREIQTVFHNQEFQSWVLTDYQTPVTFGLSRGALTLTGKPYYYFWKPEAQRSGGDPRIREVTALTRGLKAKRTALMQLNPTVHNALINAMRFAAFFRFVKRNKPANWVGFLKQMQGAPVRPNVKTPTSWRRPT